MSYARSLTALLGIFLVGYAWADTAARKATGPTVEQLIEQLASKDYQVREKASKALADALMSEGSITLSCPLL